MTACILAPQTCSAATDQTLYNRWYSYNQRGYCVPGVVVNPDLGIVAGTAPTLYGEVELGHRSDERNLLRLDQCSSRILCYSNKCFSLYAKTSVIHLRYYQRNDDTGTVYVLSQHFNHSPSDQMQVLLCKLLQNVVYGEHQGQNVYVKGLDEILLNMVKIVLFMELRADTIYRASEICDQFTSQEHYHPSPHSLNTATFPTFHGFGVPSIANGPQSMSHVEMWKWRNMVL